MASFLWYIIFLGVVVCIVMALKILFVPARFHYKQVSFENFLFLGCTYVVIMIGFGLLFLLLELKGLEVFIDPGVAQNESWYKRLGTSIYLSAITLFSVGYGDVIPVGTGRLLVVIEALLGYTIPAAFVVRTFIDHSPPYRNKE